MGTNIRDRVLSYMHNIGEPCDAELIQRRTSTGYSVDQIDSCLRAMARDGLVREVVAGQYGITGNGLRRINVGPEKGTAPTSKPATKPGPSKKAAAKKAVSKKRGSEGDDIVQADQKPRALIVGDSSVAELLREAQERLEQQGFTVENVDRKIAVLGQLGDITAPDISEVLNQIREDFVRFDELTQ